MGNLLQWCAGNRGTKEINPYGVEEVRDALMLLAEAQSPKPENYVDAASPYREDWSRFPVGGTQYRTRLRNGYTIWQRKSGFDVLYTITPNDKRPSIGAGGYMSLDAILKLKGM